MKKYLLHKFVAIIFCTYISCSLRAQYVTLPDANFVAALDSLGFSSCFNGDQLDTTCPDVLQATIIDLSNFTTDIADLTGIQYFKSLDTLVGPSTGSITYIPAVPPNLEYLELYPDGYLDSLPAFPQTLKYLQIEQGDLRSLPPLPDSLQTLLCAYNLLTTLPQLPQSLITIDCSTNKISSLPTLPDSTASFTGSQGYVQYKIKLIDGLSTNTQISNTASVYFDYNPAVITNTVVSTVGDSNALGDCNTTYDTVSIAICSGQTFYIGSTPYTQTGTYLDTLSNAGGCDSIVTLNLSVQSVFYDTINAAICSGQTYTFNGVAYTTSANFTTTLTAVGGCDSLVTLNLLVVPVFYDTTYQSICSGQTVLFQGIEYGVTGIYTNTYTAVGGCDSLVTLNLYVQTIQYDTTNQEICYGDSFAFNGILYGASGTYIDTFTSSIGCDSVISMLNLTVNPVFYDTISRNICAGDTFNFNGTLYTTAGSFVDTLQAVNTCDSIVTLNLQVTPIIRDTINRAICPDDSISFNGKWYSMAGDYTDTLESSTGCDSLATLVLRVALCGGITNVTLNGDIEIYPNPTANSLFIKVTEAIPDNLKLYNISGQLIYTGRFTPELDVSNLSPGAYFIEIQASGLTGRKMFVKM